MVFGFVLLLLFVFLICFDSFHLSCAVTFFSLFRRKECCEQEGVPLLCSFMPFWRTEEEKKECERNLGSHLSTSEGDEVCFFSLLFLTKDVDLI